MPDAFANAVARAVPFARRDVLWAVHELRRAPGVVLEPENHANGAIPLATPQPPTLTSAQRTSSGVRLDWTPAPRTTDGGAEVTSYEISRGTAAGHEKPLTTVGLVTYFLDTSAASGTTYYYEVAAVNAAGAGPASNELSVALGGTATVPGSPVLVSAVPGDSGVALTWNPPAGDGGAPVTGYLVYRGTSSGSELAALPVSLGSVASYTDPSAVNGTRYFYEVVAVNAAGDGKPSNELSAAAGWRFSLAPYDATSLGSTSANGVAVGDLAGTGRDEILVTTSDGHLLVFSQAPDGSLLAPVSLATGKPWHDSTPGAVAAGNVKGTPTVVVGIEGTVPAFQVFQQEGGALSAANPNLTGESDEHLAFVDAPWDGTSFLATVGTASSDVQLFFDLTSSMPSSLALGPSSYGEVASGDVTGDGNADVLALSRGGSEANLAVVPYVDDHSFNEPGVLYPLPGAATTGGLASGDVTGDGLDDAVVGYQDANGTSHLAVLTQDASGSLTPPVSYTSSSLPIAIAVADVNGDGRSDVIVLHHDSVGVYLEQGNGTLGAESTFPIPAAGATDNSLAVADINGDGQPDVVVADGTAGLIVLRNTSGYAWQTPSAPHLDATAVDAGGITLSWTPPDSPGGSISAYRIYRGDASGGETSLGTTGATTRFTDTTAVHGKTYYYEVAAINGAGEGSTSNELSATAAEVSPDPPRLIASIPTSTSVSLQWAAPASDGGSPVTAYIVLRRTEDDAVPAAIATVDPAAGSLQTYLDTTVASNVNYYYSVAAVNAIGQSGNSNELAASTSAADTKPPSKPTSLKAAVVGTTTVVLDWAASNDNVGVTGYRVYRDGNLLETTAARDYLDSGLDPGASHTYQIRAVDLAGNESSSPSAKTVTTKTITTSSSGALSGAVFDTTGKPITNATVTVTGPTGVVKTATTTATGIWKATGLKPGASSITISNALYATNASTVTVLKGETVAIATTLPAISSAATRRR